MQSISRLSCIFIDTPDLESCVDFYSRCFGLTVSGRQPDAAALTGSASGARQVVLRAAKQARLAGLEFLVGSRMECQALSAALGTSGVSFVADDLPFPVGDAFVVLDPDHGRIRIGSSDQIASGTLACAGVERDRPAFLSHVVINSPAPAALIDFYVGALGFRVADAYERDLLTFLRCNQPQHHCLGISPASQPGLNHFAMDCGSIDGVMKSVGRMRQAGHEPVWGPGRHGPGGNVFCYYADPVGLVAEFTSDVLQITDDASWTPRVWARTAENANVWGTSMPSPRAVELMSGGRT